jgi:hypothetical protein
MEETRQIHLARKTVQLGVFDPEAVTVGLANGRFQPTDLAWTNGMAAWKPLGEWPEFAVAAVPASAADAADAAVAAPLAWEQAKGVSSAWVSFKEIVLRPSPTLAASRLQLGSVVPLAWVLAAISGIFLIVGGSLHAEANAAFSRQQGVQIMEALHQSKGEMKWLEPLADSLQQTSPATLTELLLKASAFALLVPLLHLLLGCWVWLGFRLLGTFGVGDLRQVDFERTVAACVLGLGAIGLLCAPLNLFPSSVNALLGLPISIALAVVVSRSIGAALRINPWAVFAWSLLLNMIVCCLGCFCVAGVLVLILG